MSNAINVDGKKLLEQLEALLTDVQRYSQTVNKYVITSTSDLFGNITSVSEAFCQISGYTENELMGKNHNLLRHPDMDSALYKELWETIKAEHCWQGELKNTKKNGDSYWVSVNIEPLKSPKGEVVGYIAIRQDITAQKIIQQLTITDELTGAYNRRYYNQMLSPEISRAQRDGKFLAFLMIDADNFKKYNDTYGHQAGDSVLKAITNVLQHSFQRAGDYVFRVGGEEFVVLYATKTHEDTLLVAEKSRQAMFDLNIEHSGNAPHHRVTLSMGLMTLDPSGHYINEEIYKYADDALYQAKQNGRNCVKVHDIEGDIELF